MRQCFLSSGGTSYVAWLPDKFAVVGKVVEIHGKNWTIKNVYGPHKEDAEVHERSRDYLRQRKASDI